MPRKARVVAPESPHHVTQRGSRQADVFLEPADHERYLELLHDYSEQHSLEILGWCLMTNHVHLVVVPPDATAMSVVMRSVHMRYAQWLNRRQGLNGHLWQNRYYSCVLDEDHCWSAMRYIEQNPVRAGVAAVAEDYPWSSAAAHCGLRTDPVASARWLELTTPAEWQALLHAPLDDQAAAEVRSRTYSGMPCGDSDFLARMSKLAGRELVVRGPGRPRRA